MKTIETSVRIDASPQTVWSVMDDLQNYPAWNRLTTDLNGRTTVGSIVRGTLTRGDGPGVPLSPTITAIVGAREFRWLTKVPDFHAEHYFLLVPTEDGGTELIHNEDFDGAAVKARWDAIQVSSPPAYQQFNEDLKARAESLSDAVVNLHPAVDDVVSEQVPRVQDITLTCFCKNEPITVLITRPIYHNHLCGCSKCWKPEGASFAQTAVVVSDGFHVGTNDNKLAVIDENQAIQRYACRDCGVHMYGIVTDANHHFYGLAFIHPELASQRACNYPEFAGFVSSIIESGTSPSLMSGIRGRFAELGIATYDAFSPELMDIIAWHKCKIAHLPNPTE